MSQYLEVEWRRSAMAIWRPSEFRFQESDIFDRIFAIVRP